MDYKDYIVRKAAGTAKVELVGGTLLFKTDETIPSKRVQTEDALPADILTTLKAEIAELKDRKVKLTSFIADYQKLIDDIQVLKP